METVPVISGLDTAWVLASSFLVFFMNAGFALLEAGFTQAKNAVNIIMKNFMCVSLATLGFYVVGFGLMFGAGTSLMGKEYFMLSGLKEVWGTIPGLAFFLFQVMFAATAATIVSGAIAERTRFLAFLLFTFVMTAFIYSVVGHWAWGGGWLAERGFVDFAGSTVVHSVGGWAALVGVLLVGPRIGRFAQNYDERRFSGHSIPLAALGTFILWFGWFGFNPGSQLGAEGAANSQAIALIAVNTNLAAVAGSLSALVMGWLMTRLSKAGFALNGALAGLVAITAPCAVVTPGASIIIGALAGVVMILVADLLEKLKIDDAVGAVPVHLGNGIFGTLAVGLFSTKAGVFYGYGWELFTTQLIGVLAVGAFVLVSAFVVFSILKATVGIRVSEHIEKEGLDLKHGHSAYPDFSAV